MPIRYQYDRAFLTGCDRSTQWMLPWFLEHYRRHHSTPLVFADFGVTNEMRAFMAGQVDCMINMQETIEQGWFKKPKAMIACPALQTVWIDTDCQILANCDGIFDNIEPDKLSMVEDKPWSMRREEIWHNSGIVAFERKPRILTLWAEQIAKNPEVGDQEVLHSMLDPVGKLVYIKDLDNKYNVLRLQLEDRSYKGKPSIIHWTGRKGKIKIKEMIDGK